MIPMSGTVVIARHEAGTDGHGTHRTCNVLAIQEDGDFLVAPLNDEPRPSSDIVIIEQFVPSPQHSATPGCWGRFKIEVDEVDEHQTTCFLWSGGVSAARSRPWCSTTCIASRKARFMLYGTLR